MARWIRFAGADGEAFGQIERDQVRVFEGNLFDEPNDTGHRLPLAGLRLLPPCRPGKLIGLWNNFKARAAHEGWSQPPHPLYFIKTDNCYAAHGDPIIRPEGYDGPVVFEGELGIVIGKRCHQVLASEADSVVFGYTCVNDVTARAILKADPSFPQWVRAKSFDTFGPFGPAIATGLEPDVLTVRTRVNGKLLQDYPVADMFYRPRDIIARISQDMTLHPGDIIACGTSLGAGPMDAGDLVEVEVDGIGILANRVHDCA